MQLQAHECAPAENCALIKLCTLAKERQTVSFHLHSAIKALFAMCWASLRVTMGTDPQAASAGAWGGLEQDEATEI